MASQDNSQKRRSEVLARSFDASTCCCAVLLSTIVAQKYRSGVFFSRQQLKSRNGKKCPSNAFQKTVNQTCCHFECTTQHVVCKQGSKPSSTSLASAASQTISFLRHLPFICFVVGQRLATHSQGFCLLNNVAIGAAYACKPHNGQVAF